MEARVMRRDKYDGDEHEITKKKKKIPRKTIKKP